MIKYLGIPTVTFAEFPDEIALVFNITNCPGNCSRCSEPELLEDVGEELSESLLISLIKQHPGITMVGFLGGDRAHDEIVKLVEVVHGMSLKAGMYSGQEYLDMDLLNCLDYYKIGRWIYPEGPVEDWWRNNCGPLKFTFSNQLMFKRVDKHWVNITSKFREKPLNNLQQEII